jgi:hypothetical protein
MPFIHIKSLPMSVDNGSRVLINPRYVASGMVMDAEEIIRW